VTKKVLEMRGDCLNPANVAGVVPKIVEVPD
jgi:hypothetical protein